MFTSNWFHSWTIVTLVVILTTSSTHGINVLSSVSNLESSVQLLEVILSDQSKNNVSKVSSPCLKSLQVLLGRVLQGDDSAVKVVSSFVHTAPLLKSGQLADFGHYDACIAAVIEPESSSFGKYCLYQQHFKVVPPRNPLLQKSDSLPEKYYHFLDFESPTGSICLPSQCHEDEITWILNSYFTPEETYVKLRLKCDTQQDLNSEKENQNGGKEIVSEFKGQKIALYSLLSWLVFMAAVNLYLVIKNSSVKVTKLKEKETTVMKVIECFSIQEIVTRLTDDDANDDFKFIYGFRMIFFIGSTIFHIFFLPIFWSPLAVINIFNYSRKGHTWLNQEFGSNMSAGMPLAFVIAAFLSFKSRLKEIQMVKGGRETTIYVLRSVLNRCLRCLPAVGGCYLILLSFPRHWGSGPLFQSSYDQVMSNCLTNWPKELLFLQNTLHPKDMCLMPSWILAPDIQLYLASFVVIFLYQKNRNLTKKLIGVLVVISIIIEAIYILAWDLPPFMDLASYNYRDLYERQTGLHLNTINYLPAYLIGLLCAIYVHEKMTITSKYLFGLLMVTCWSMYLSNYFIPLSWRSRGEDNVSRLEKVLFGSTSRVFFSLAVAGSFLDQCNISKGGWCHKILSCKLLVILGRFSFSSYLGHFLVMYYDVFTTRSPLLYDNYTMLSRTSVVLFLGIALGLVIHILFEAPSIRLSKVLIPRKTKVPRPSDTANNNVFSGSGSDTSPESTFKRSKND